LSQRDKNLTDRQLFGRRFDVADAGYDSAIGSPNREPSAWRSGTNSAA